MLNDAEPIRILQVVRAFDRSGGVETVAFELQRAWRQAGVDSRVLASSIADDADAAEADLLLPWLARFPTRGRGRYLGLLLSVPLFTLFATQRQRRAAQGRWTVSHGDSLSGDICVIHAVNAASLAEKQRAGKRLWRLNPMHHWVGLRDRRSIGRLQFKRYVAISHRVKTELQELYGVPDDRIAIIPNGVNIDRFQTSRTERAVVRDEFRIPQAAPLLLFVGHEFERKGLAFVIQALAKLPAETHLLVVGNDNAAPYRAIAASSGIAPGRIAFTGARADLPRLYSAADLFVFPTYYEAFSLVCMEALASGLPVFATEVGGIEDYIVEGKNGGFFERNADSIADRLAPVLANPALRQRLAEGARATAESYAWPRIAQRYVDLLNSLGAVGSGVAAAA